MAMQEYDTEDVEEPGLTERVTGAARRTAGAVGHAARGIAGRPEAGTDRLYQIIHAEHEEANQLFEKLLATEGGTEAERLWKELAVSLTSHARVEQEVVYKRLIRHDETSELIREAYEEHDQVERLCAEADAMGVGTDEFYALVSDLQLAVRHHVDEEEGDLLPRAAEVLDDKERDRLVERWRQRKQEMLPEILGEWGVEGGRGGKRGSSGGRKAQSGGRSRSSGAKSRGGRAAARSASGDLEQHTVQELYQMAKEREIEGRSNMNKKELIHALKKSR